MGAHVLVVDDDMDIRATLRFLLEEEGYTVSEATDGVSALHVMRDRAQPRSVVLLDRSMPRLNGIEVLRQIATDHDQDFATRHRIIFLTAHNELPPPEEQAILSELDVPLVFKPFELTDLLRAVAGATDKLDGDGARHPN